VKEEIPVVEEEPEPPKPESIKEVSEVDDSKDWFAADDLKKEPEQPEGMWFVPVDTYTGGFTCELVSKTLEAKEEKEKEEEKKAEPLAEPEALLVQDLFEDEEVKEASQKSKDFFAPDDISRKSEQYD